MIKRLPVPFKRTATRPLPTAKKGQCAIQVEGVYKSFYTANGQEIPILKNVGFTIHPGEFIMIQGQSGSGKSTLLNILNGWEDPTQGSVSIHGENIYTWTEDERARLRWEVVSLIHQTPSWVQSLSVLENIAIPHMLAGARRRDAYERAHKLLALIGFERFATYKSADLSGGQQQRVAFLRGLVNNPSIIMADEPTGNLDSASSEIIMSLFQKVNKEFHRTVIMVTHNLDLLSYADRIVRVKDGMVTDVEGEEPSDSKLPTGDLVDIKLPKEFSVPTT